MSQEQDKFSEYLYKNAVPQLVNATVLIARVGEDEKFKPDRSGVLIRIAQEVFILTAAHKLVERIKSNTPLCVVMQKDAHIVPLIDSNFHGIESDSRDVAVIKLSTNAA